MIKADGAWWAEADREDAAQQMRAARALAGSTNESLAAAARVMFSPAGTGERMSSRLNEVFRAI